MGGVVQLKLKPFNSKTDKRRREAQQQEVDINFVQQTKKQKKRRKLLEKIEMYDMMLANFIAGDSIIEPDQALDNSKICIGFSNIASETIIQKYFLVHQLPDWMDEDFIGNIRNQCLRDGVKIDFYFYIKPHRINWDSPEMVSRLRIWKNYAKENEGEIGVFDYRKKRRVALNTQRIVMSTKYLNEAELDYGRSTMKAQLLIKVTGVRDDVGLYNMGVTIEQLKIYCNKKDIMLRELKVNLMDWIAHFGVFCMKHVREIVNKSAGKVLTDDNMALFNSYTQGRIGDHGTPIGMDVESGSMVYKKFKQVSSAPENWIITAETGFGKSNMMKYLIPFWLDEFVVTIFDYEGDEYTGFARFLQEADPTYAKVISAGKGNTEYFDPMELPFVTGDTELDKETKESAVQYTVAIFRTINCGVDGKLTRMEEKMISLAIKRVYNAHLVSDDTNTWKNSKGIRISMVYQELKKMYEEREFMDETTNNEKHKALTVLVDNASVYFEPGEAKYGVFKNAVPASSLFGARFIVFSFGMKGETGNQADPVILALKQLSVSRVAIQISNYCKYVLKMCNIKVWEEFQRWSKLQGSSEIILNGITGGRKRGEANIIVTNSLSEMLDDKNPILMALRSNIQNFLIGRITDLTTREKFCHMYRLEKILPELENIAKTVRASGSGLTRDEIAEIEELDKYLFSFCAVLDNGKKAVVKARVPREVLNSRIYHTGVDL